MRQSSAPANPTTPAHGARPNLPNFRTTPDPTISKRVPFDASRLIHIMGLIRDISGLQLTDPQGVNERT